VPVAPGPVPHCRRELERGAALLGLSQRWPPPPIPRGYSRCPSILARISASTARCLVHATRGRRPCRPSKGPHREGTMRTSRQPGCVAPALRSQALSYALAAAALERRRLPGWTGLHPHCELPALSQAGLLTTPGPASTESRHPQCVSYIQAIRERGPACVRRSTRALAARWSATKSAANRTVPARLISTVLASGGSSPCWRACRRHTAAVAELTRSSTGQHEAGQSARATRAPAAAARS
jgi:hypothetical protein